MGALKYWIWLSSLAKPMGGHSYALLRQFGTPEAAYAADDAAYDFLPTLPHTMREALRNKSLARAEKILSDCEAANIRLLTLHDVEYPERLRQIPDPPCLLYLKGRLPQMDEELVIAMVGARESTPYGEVAARRFGMDLAKQGAIVVSGIARGIDAAALTGALTGGGRVVSVLGNGIDVVYPQSSRDLYEDIPTAGALLSEYPPGTKPEGSHFPVRNRLISALSLGTLVVEGGERSGSLITARLSLEQNRDVFAIPGNWDASMSRGPNLLIQRGEAKLVMSAWDILEEYQHAYPHKLQEIPPLSPPSPYRSERGGSKTAVPPPPTPEPARIVLEASAVTDDERAILKTLQDHLHTADELIEATSLPAKRVLSALTMLQVRNLVQEENGKRFGTAVILKEE